ncbi:MAG: hypothetical protein D6693_05425 [Planctomycetota bacterium]|nr:MAG: hypothetical protein D6693_05425 [Planctomycetota bacterium]
MMRPYVPLILALVAAVLLSRAAAPAARVAAHAAEPPAAVVDPDPPGVAPASAFRGFGTPAFYQFGPLGVGPEGFRTGDLTGDGYADIAVANSQRDDVAILINNGDATFTLGAPVPTPILPFDVTIADFNGDTLGDLAVAFFGTTPTDPPHNGGVGVYLSTAPGRFAPGVFYAAGADPHNVDVGDLDGDGDIDIVAFAQTSSEFAVLLNTGDGAFTGPDLYPTGRVPQDGALGDLDGDGDLDAVGGSAFDNNFAVHINKGDGTFAETGFVEMVSAFHIAIGDLTGDGADEVVVQSSATSVDVIQIRDDRSFIRLGPFLINEQGLASRDKRTVPIDADFTTDLGFVNVFPGPGFVRGDGAGNLLQPVIPIVDVDGNELRFADLDNDGDQDFLFVTTGLPGGPTLGFGVLVLLNLNVDLPSIDLSGDGVINAQEIALVLAAWGDAGGPADLNHDGVVDGGDLSVILNLFGQTVPGRGSPGGVSPAPTI